MAIDLRKKNRGAERTRLENVVKQAAGGKKKRTGQPQTQDAPKSNKKKNENQKSAQPQGKNQNVKGRAGHTEQRKKDQNAASNRGGKLDIIPIGGLGEIGKNFTVFRHQGEILIVDCGMSFPDDEMFGIDVVIPELTFIEENADRVKGIFVTHGHEDHIGGIPYLLKKVNAPIYGTRLTLGLIESKLQEHGLKGDFRHINADQKLKIGSFKIETIRVTHSVADALALTIETSAGTVFHSGDFKIDYTPIDGDPMDFQKLAEIGKHGIDLLLCDSTNALRKGFTESEQKLGPVLDEIFRGATSRIIIATFASNVHRVQTIINTAVKNKRKVALSGRSMLRVMELAMDLGYLSIPKGVLVELDDIGDIPDKKLVIITTGSQGEPMSALTRMSAGEHRNVKIRRGDMVILSSSPIPGNEKTVSNVVNSLIGLGADVIYSDIADIHVSGHASQEEIKILLRLLRPKSFMPVHGENKHLMQNAELAETMGIPKKNIILSKNGNVIEMRNGNVQLTKDTVPAAAIFVDGLGVGDIGTSVLKDRKQLSESGLIIVSATIDEASGFVISGPDVLSRGFVYEKMSSDLIDDLRKIAADELEIFERDGMEDREAMKNKIRSSLKSYIYTRTQRNPVIITILMEA